MAESRRAKKPKTAKKRPATRRKKARTAAGAKLRVRQVRSGIGHARVYRRTLEALGLRYQREIVVADTASMRGMLQRVRHLVRVIPEEA